MQRHLAGPMLTTAEMPLWTGNGPAPEPIWTPVDYGTGLEPYVPFWARPEARLPRPYARRADHSGRHFPKLRRGQIGRWVGNALREAGEFLVGSFQPIREAW